MNIIQINSDDAYWNKLREYSQNCTWDAGKTLSRILKEQTLEGWERVFIAVDIQEIVGFCTVTKSDCIPSKKYSPYIGFIFVDEKYRGNRISERMINEAAVYAGSLGFKYIYIASNHNNLYEKYGFKMIDELVDMYGCREKIYVRETI